jgi:hypothetical protein
VLRLVLVCSLLPAVAFAQSLEAQLAPYNLDETDRAIMRALWGGDIVHSFDVSAHASLAGTAGRTTGGQANAGGEIAWNLGKCRALVGGGDATADKTSEGEQLSGSIWGGFCLPFPMNRFEMIIKSDYLLQPRLSALPIARRARYTGFSIDFKNTFIGWRSETREHAILPFTFTIGTFAQPELDVGYGAFTIAAYRRTYNSGRMIEVLPVELRSAGPTEPADGGGFYLSSHAYAFSPFRIARTSTGSLGDYELEADFVAGLAYANITKAPVGGMQAAPVLHRTYDLYTDVTLRATKGEDTFSAHLRRSFEPTYTDELLLDTRGELSWYRTHGKHGVLFGVFGAVTKRIDRAGPIDSTPSAGARGVYNYALPGHTQFALSAEVARSFYATLDDTVALDADWSAQLNAAFTFAWARHPVKGTIP